MRVSLVTNIATPYRIPMYRAIADELGDDFHVILLSRSEKNRAWKLDELPFRHTVVPGRHLYVSSRDWALHLNVGVGKAIRAHRPDVVVIAGYDNPSYWAALAAAKLAHIPVVLWSGSHSLSGRSNRGPAYWLKQAFVRSADAYFTYGTLAADFLVELGARREAITVGTNAVESPRFMSGPSRLDARRSVGGCGENDKVMLFSGQLIARKGVDVLIRAAAHVRGAPLLWIIGDGAERAAYERLANELMPERVSFLGHRPYAELPTLYAAADLFVMPSRVEVWGLVLNEAMAAGLPVVSTRQAGATADLVEGKGTGFSYDAEDERELTAHLQALLDDDGLRAKCGARARELIARRDTRQYAKDLLSAARMAVRAKVKWRHAP